MAVDLGGFEHPEPAGHLEVLAPAFVWLTRIRLPSISPTESKELVVEHRAGKSTRALINFPINLLEVAIHLALIAMAMAKLAQ